MGEIKEHLTAAALSTGSIGEIIDQIESMCADKFPKNLKIKCVATSSRARYATTTL